jgi:hypothetical protein
VLVPGSTVYWKLPVYMWKAKTVICNCVIYNLKVPDDDPNKGSKHAGLVHCDCIV